MSETENNGPLTNIGKSMTVDDMWGLVGGKTNWGIEGYEPPRHYYDYAKIKWGEKVKEMIKNPRKNIQWPPKDKEGNPVVFKRPNYLDQIQKWATSYYDKERAEKVIEDLAAHDRTIDPPKKTIDKTKTSLYKHNRTGYIDSLINDEKKKYKQYPEKEDLIEEIKEKIKEEGKAKKDYVAVTKEKYAGKGSMPTCDRITIVADAEHVGEKIPFYVTPAGEDDEPQVDEDGKKKKKNYDNLFNPKKNPTWHQDPKWGFMMQKPIKKDEDVHERRNDQTTQRLEELQSQLKDKKNDGEINVSKSYHTVKSHGKLYPMYHKKHDYPNEEHYQRFRENNPISYPGPQQYWNMPAKKITKKKFKGNEDTERPENYRDEIGEKKVFYWPRKRADNFQYKPMKSHIF